MNNIDSILQFHRLLSLPAPLHPLISVIHLEDIRFKNDDLLKSFFTNFYSISLKKDVQARMKYGHHYYDFDKGMLSFTAPKQVQVLDLAETDHPNNGAGNGYALMFHPDFLYGHPLTTSINKYGFFSYMVNEALHLSEKEEKNIEEIFLKIHEEYQYIDNNTQYIILPLIELLLNYSKRFYERQFVTRKAVNHDVLTRMEQLLNEYFDGEKSVRNGLPTVESISSQLNLSPHYLSDLLRSLTGQSAQHHIQERLILKAKEYLTVTNLSVAEIAYQLGFEYPQSFNKLFKRKTSFSPLEFRASFK
jgi:AraC family transcriptional regulator, transcriptional activator of pobA